MTADPFETGRPKPSAWVFCFCFCLSFLAVASVQAQERSRLFEAEAWREMGRRLTDSTSVSLLSMGAYTTALATGGDFPMRDLWGHEKQMDERTTDLGDALGTGVPGVMTATLQYAFGDLENGDHHARALIGAFVATHSLKFAVGRRRPGTSPDRRSFPSGHTSTTFATATSLSYAYGWKAGVVAYPLAVLTGLSRISSDSHWFSDTVGGAFIGIWAARAAFLDSDPRAESSWRIVPVIDSEFAGAQIAVSF
jgi:hypothetical protein